MTKKDLGWIIASKARGRVAQSRMTFANKLDTLDKLKERSAIMRAGRKQVMGAKKSQKMGDR